MSDADRQNAIEEALMRLESEIDQLDHTARAQASAHDELPSASNAWSAALRTWRMLRRMEPRMDTNEHEY